MKLDTIYKLLVGQAGIRKDLFGLLMLLLLCMGCGGKPASVSGVVTLDGEPIAKGVVGFTPVSGGMRATGLVQSDGSYELNTNKASGLEVGEYIATVVAREPGPETAQGPPMPGKFITPRRYAQSDTSGLQFKVEPGFNRIDIKLTTNE